MVRYKRFFLKFGLAACLNIVVLTGCSPIENNRGNIPKVRDVSELQIGTHTRADVQAIIGTPSSIGTFDDSTWYYIGRQTERFAFFEDDVVDQQVVSVSFDEEGKLTNIQRYNKGDAYPINSVGRVTPTMGQELNFFQQIFRNIGQLGSKE